MNFIQKRDFERHLGNILCRTLIWAKHKKKRKINVLDKLVLGHWFNLAEKSYNFCQNYSDSMCSNLNEMKSWLNKCMFVLYRPAVIWRNSTRLCLLCHISRGKSCSFKKCMCVLGRGVLNMNIPDSWTTYSVVYQLYHHLQVNTISSLSQTCYILNDLCIWPSLIS